MIIRRSTWVKTNSLVQQMFLWMSPGTILNSVADEPELHCVFALWPSQNVVDRRDGPIRKGQVNLNWGILRDRRARRGDVNVGNSIAPTPRTHRLRIGLRAGLGTIAVFAVLFALVDYWVRAPYRDEQRAAAVLVKLGGSVLLVEDSRGWVRIHVGPDIFDNGNHGHRCQ